jgi:hypothetical protein
MPTEAPEQITARNLADYLDVLTKAVFQSGISWRVVEAKWAGTREASADSILSVSQASRPPTTSTWRRIRD